MNFLILQDVTFRYEDMKMHFSLAVEEGECLAVIGPSGSGKSTLLSLIAGFDRPLSGKILIGGRDVTALPPQQREVAILFQDHNLFPHLTIWENVALGLKDPAGQTKLIEASLAKVGLKKVHSRLPGELSGGERQRVALARSLLTQAPLLLLDEPFGALGPGLKHEILLLTDELRKESGLTVLLVSHDPSDVRAIATRIAFLEAGKILAIGKPDEILLSGHAAIRGYLGSLPA